MLRTFVFSLIFFIVSAHATELSSEYQSWLKEKFSAQHEALIPVVAVADMYFACNRERKVEPQDLSVEALVTKLGRNELAVKLSNCLKGELPNSNTALNFGLIGCFHEQLKSLPEKDRAVKEKLVLQAIKKLSKAQRQQSFTQCVTDQAIGYLK